MTTTPFGATQRHQLLQQAGHETFDLLVIGGGITGAGIALDAASRGLNVILVEKRDFAWGTSSRSTKLIHGGLRYLKQLEFGLVHEVGVERAIVHHNARHVVLSERMLLPIVEGGSLGRRLSSIGLWIYDRLAGVEKKERRRMLSVADTLASEPLLRQEGLQGGGLYYEYRTDDARLTIEVLKTAVSYGAVCLNYAEVSDFIYDGEERVRGVHLQDTLTGQSLEVQARCIVNAAGPWVDELRAKDKEGVQHKRLHLTKGVHIVVPFSRLPLRQSAYFDVLKDKRMVFAIPRFGVTYIGTTDTTYGDSINQPIATEADVHYILAAANAMFPSAQLTDADVVSTWAGLRPLIHQDGKSPSELSRKDEIFESRTGLLSIAGGKLTGYRRMAERITDVVSKRLHQKTTCRTKELQLLGGQFQSNEAFQAFIQEYSQQYPELDSAAIPSLAYKYGSQLVLILQRYQSQRAYAKDAEECLQAAELWYGVEFEMVQNLCDYLVRRTGRLYFDRPSIERWLPFWAERMADMLGWSESRKQAEIEAFRIEYEAVMQWRKASPLPSDRH